MGKPEEFTENRDKAYSPSGFFRNVLVWVLAICVSPVLLNALGIDFSSQPYFIDMKELARLDLSYPLLLDQMFYALAGGLHHGLLEWTSVVVAVFTVVLSFVHFRSSSDITVPIIGLALLFSGLMDGFHTLAAMRLIEGVADNSNLVPFTWAMSRGFHAIILVAGTCAALFFIRGKSLNENGKSGRFNHRKAQPWLLLAALIFISLGYVLVRLVANSEVLPQTQFPDNFITRPYDVFPLMTFVLSAPLFWYLHKKKQTIFTAALILQLLPETFLEAHMAFGSSQLFDNHFNIAHFLKIVAYTVPFLGLLVDYTGTYKAKEYAEKTADVAQEKADLATAPLNAILKTAADAIIVMDGQGTIRTFNSAAQSMFGYAEAEALGQNIKLVIGWSEGLDTYLQKGTQTGTKNISGGRHENIAYRRNGGAFPIEFSVSEAATPSGLFITSLIRDISDRKASERLIKEQINELKETNGELDKFAYIASHDLKAPLRSIEHLVEWISEDQEDPEAVKEHIEMMNSRIKRMERLLDDLLQYSRVGRKKMESRNIDTAEIIRNQIDMTSSPPGFTFKLEGDMPVITTLAVPFELVMRNLISNAVKHHDREDGIVRIYSNDSGDFYDFIVEDDGPGIDKEFHQKIFEIFQTLKSRDEIEGSGIGLALIKKTTQVYGGDIWMDSEKGRGAKFILRWPKGTKHMQTEHV